MAVKPTVLMDEPGASTSPAQLADARRYSVEFWKAVVADKPAQTGLEEQTILPKPQDMMGVRNNEAMMSRPFFALNVRRSIPFPHRVSLIPSFPHPLIP